MNYSTIMVIALAVGPSGTQMGSVGVRVANGEGTRVERYQVALGADAAICAVSQIAPIAGPLPTIQIIDQVCADPESYEDGEVMASEKAIGDLKGLLADAGVIYKGEIETGHVAPYFGELSITWRNGDRMLRVTSFTNEGKSPRLDFGTTPHLGRGHFEFDSNATGQKLADKLAWLYRTGD